MIIGLIRDRVVFDVDGLVIVMLVLPVRMLVKSCLLRLTLS